MIVERLDPVREDRDSPSGSTRGDEWFDRGTRLTSPLAGTVPLLLLERSAPLAAGSPPLADLRVSVVRPSLVVDTWPDCGCDACDSGSEDLLEAIDESVIKVVGGPLVLLRGPRWHAQWYPDGGSSGGKVPGPDHAWLMDKCRRLAAGERVRIPAGVEAVVGRGWVG